MKVHELKSWPESFAAIRAGQKTHELRRADRDFQVGDVLLLREYDPKSERYSGQSLRVVITFMTTEANSCAISKQALAPGYSILSVKLS